MNNQERNNYQNNCMSDILKVILILQQTANENDSCLDTCDRGFLGQQNNPTLYNTRPISLYTCNNLEPLAMPISKNPTETTTSSIFRLEKLDNCCATFRVLVVNDDDNTYTTTASFFTLNLNCLCCIRCLNDTYIEGI